MKIFSIGDSHSSTTFKGLPVIPQEQTGRTMYRIGQMGKLNIQKNQKTKKIEIQKEDILIVCFGEVDVRCHIHKHIINSLEEVIIPLVEKYFESIKNSTSNIGCKVYVMSIVPPAYNDQQENSTFPFLGTDEERKMYCVEINKTLQKYCKINNLNYLDIYSLYADENGMLNKSLSDGHVHIKDTSLVGELFKDIGII